MKDPFIKYIKENDLFPMQDRLLLAVSGGVDSVVMAHLFKRYGPGFGIAHCNFKLREQASDEDASFVKALAQELQVPHFEIEFDTENIARKQKKNIQLIAREMRYQWLEEIRSTEGFDYIATAHHLDDNIETILYNWTKGTGIKGMTGIPAKNGFIVRPLLFAARKEIEDFANSESIAFRTDLSNETDKYSRNKIRHHVVPVLRQINPALSKTAADNAENAKAIEYWYLKAINEVKSGAVKEDETGTILIQKNRVIDLPFLENLLYEWFSEVGLKRAQAVQLATVIREGSIGKLFFTPSHRVLIDRDYVFIEPKGGVNAEEEAFTIALGQKELQLPGASLKFTKVDPNAMDLSLIYHSEPEIAYLALKQDDFPVKVRHWQPGDVFKPLGMKGKSQKLQDYFSNRKISRFEKEQIWIMETNNGKICWIIGHRISEIFKITSPVTPFYKVELFK